MGGELLLALTAGMLGAVNPCGFALLPAYLSVLVAAEPGRPARAVGRALRAGAALAIGYAVVFGAFGLVLTPIAGALQPRLPWMTVVLGLVLAALGVWLLAGRSLPSITVRAPALTGSTGSTVLFGMAYAVASLGCAVGPFLALVVSSLLAGSVGSGVLLFLAYALGMALVVSATAVAVALVRVSLITRVRGLLAAVPRVGGAVLVVCGLYVAYYGWYELRLAGNLRLAGTDPVINAAAVVQRWLSSSVSSLGAWPFVAIVVPALVAVVVLTKKRPARGGPFSSERVADQGVRRPAVCADELGLGLLRRHHDPEDRVDQDLAARDGQQDDDEEQAGQPRVDPVAAGESRDDTGEEPALARPGEALAGHAVVHGVHKVFLHLCGSFGLIRQWSGLAAPINIGKCPGSTLSRRP